MSNIVAKVLAIFYLSILLGGEGQAAFFSYNFVSSLEKVTYAILLGCCVILCAVGVIKRRFMFGKLIIVSAVCIWLFLGLMSIVLTG
jgi:hypothetical protein